jgi:hypothetical protein
MINLASFFFNAIIEATVIADLKEANLKLIILRNN